MRRVTLILAGTVIFVLALSIQTNAAVPQLINYQGVLADSTGAGLDTTVNITFGIYESAVSLTPIWVEAHTGVAVTGGLFSVLLGSTTPLDVSIFGDTTRYLGVTVGADPEISPRTRLVSVAYSFRSEQADSADLAVLALHADTADFADTAALAVLALIAELAIFADSARVADELDSLSSEDFSRTGHSHGGGATGWTDDGTVVRLDGIDDSVGIGTVTPTEKLDVVGNIHASGTIVSGNSITIDGTTDKITASSGTIDFDDENLVTTGKATIGPNNTNTGVDAFVAGAGNSATGDSSTIGGGRGNIASGRLSTIAGGFGNTASNIYTSVSGGWTNIASGNFATIGGGLSNQAIGDRSTVGGGSNNTPSGANATVSGGSLNIASDQYATVGGGRYNKARGQYSVVAGGGGAVAVDSNLASADWSTVSGGKRNVASGSRSTVTGGGRNTASGLIATVAGGEGNTASQTAATVGGGNVNIASGTAATVSGGQLHTASGYGATIGGGSNNKARGDHSTVAGGGGLTAADSNAAIGNWSSIGGGTKNLASGNHSTIGGGLNDSASGVESTVGGGTSNVASGGNSTIGGGFSNHATKLAATVAGGYQNRARGDYAGILGGLSNTTDGAYAIVLGGRFARADSAYSLAAGWRAHALHRGSFVFADTSSNVDFNSSANNQFNIRAAGGTRIYSNGALTTGVTLSAGGGAWVAVSDSAVKRNIRPVDEFDILEKVASLPISRWSYETQSPDIEHIGPTAQDFYNAFGLGEDEKGISTLDPDGVSLASIKALYKENKELKSQILKVQAESRKDIRKLEKILKELLDSK